MRDPIEVLKNLSEKSKDKTYKFQRVYRNLYNPEFYYTAYRNIYANGGSMTPGVDGSTMDGLSDKRIENIINSLKNQSYKPLPARREYIKKENSIKKRPLGIQTGNDKLVQEVMRMILESIYEPTFSKYSHGFRQHRSCHTALLHIQKTFAGTTRFIEGDITECFDSFDHHVVIELIRKRIDDDKFINLMWKFMKAGYMEQWNYNDSYSGVPQGSGMSPILANIYLHELDKFVEEYQIQFAKNNKRSNSAPSKEYQNTVAKTHYRKKKNTEIWHTLSAEEKRQKAKEIRQLQNLALGTQQKNYADTRFKNMRYVRYADDFVIGVIGSKRDAEELKIKLANFLQERLKLTLSEKKTQITHSTERVRFLGYDVSISHSQTIKKEKNGRRRRVYSGNVYLFVPHEKWENKLREYNAIRIKKDGKGKDQWRATHRSKLIRLKDIDILYKYNSEVRGLYNYYCIANNAWVIGQFAGLMKHSMLKTLAAKYRTKVRKIKARYDKNGKFTITYTTKSGLKDSVFVNGFGRKKEALLGSIDAPPFYRRYERRNSLKARLKAKQCELCGKNDIEIEMHQVKQLKSLKGDKDWERVMLNSRRRTLAVCQSCHEKIHS
jgi:group II intron reverse transcriptase/maturase